MKRIIAFLKRLRLDKVLTVFMAGLLLFISAACSNTPRALAKTSDQIREEVPEGAVTSEYRGGMNDYSDVDPRRDTSAADRKAQALVENAQQNLKNRNQTGENFREGVQKAPEKIGEIGENVKETAQRNAREFAENAKTGSENLRENTRDFVEGAKETAQDTADRLGNKVSRDIETTQRAFENAAERGKDIARQGQNAAEDAASAARAKVREGIQTSQRNLNREADIID
ncbi:DUF6658 family protein [Kamptonema formosum]|uniref:DUF6658 family protein n=1 Tax=Kamptonema formosum TaxID=331992 RepID=UPI00034B8E7A|nr:DUF6658 family protein [Oscillatoria sp. PCC 10802]